MCGYRDASGVSSSSKPTYSAAVRFHTDAKLSSPTLSQLVVTVLATPREARRRHAEVVLPLAENASKNEFHLTSSLVASRAASAASRYLRCAKNARTESPCGDGADAAIASSSECQVGSSASALAPAPTSTAAAGSHNASAQASIGLAFVPRRCSVEQTEPVECCFATRFGATQRLSPPRRQAATPTGPSPRPRVGESNLQSTPPRVGVRERRARPRRGVRRISWRAQSRSGPPAQRRALFCNSRSTTCLNCSKGTAPSIF